MTSHQRDFLLQYSFEMIHPLFLIVAVSILVASILAQDVELDVQMGTEETAVFFPLLRFASIGDLESVLDELKQGKDVDEHTSSGVTAAHAAARYNHNEVLLAVSFDQSFFFFFQLTIYAIKYFFFSLFKLALT